MRSWNGEFISPRTSAYATIRAVAGTYASSSVAAAADTRVAHATRPVASDAISTLAAANRNTRVRFFIGNSLPSPIIRVVTAAPFQSPLQHILASFYRAHREPQRSDGRGQHSCHTGRIGLKVMRDCEAPQVSRQNRGQLFPPEYKQEAPDKRPPEQDARPEEDSAVCRKSECQHSEIADERPELRRHVLKRHHHHEHHRRRGKH